MLFEFTFPQNLNINATLVAGGGDETYGRKVISDCPVLALTVSSIYKTNCRLSLPV